MVVDLVRSDVFTPGTKDDDTTPVPENQSQHAFMTATLADIGALFTRLNSITKDAPDTDDTLLKISNRLKALKTEIDAIDTTGGGDTTPAGVTAAQLTAAIEAIESKLLGEDPEEGLETIAALGTALVDLEETPQLEDDWQDSTHDDYDTFGSLSYRRLDQWDTDRERWRIIVPENGLRLDRNYFLSKSASFAPLTPTQAGQSEGFNLVVRNVGEDTITITPPMVGSARIKMLNPEGELGDQLIIDSGAMVGWSLYQRDNGDYVLWQYPSKGAESTTDTSAKKIQIPNQEWVPETPTGAANNTEVTTSLDFSDCDFIHFELADDEAVDQGVDGKDWPMATHRASNIVGLRDFWIWNGHNNAYLRMRITTAQAPQGKFTVVTEYERRVRFKRIWTTKAGYLSTSISRSQIAAKPYTVTVSGDNSFSSLGKKEGLTGIASSFMVDVPGGHVLASVGDVEGATLTIRPDGIVTILVPIGSELKTVTIAPTFVPDSAAKRITTVQEFIMPTTTTKNNHITIDGYEALMNAGYRLVDATLTVFYDSNNSVVLPGNHVGDANYQTRFNIQKNGVVNMSGVGTGVRGKLGTLFLTYSVVDKKLTPN